MNNYDIAIILEETDTVRFIKSRRIGSSGHVGRGNQSESCMAVSYTHLDVYKRQGIDLLL